MVSLSDDIKREIGQHFVFGFHGHKPSPEIATLIREYHLGSVILMKRNVVDAKQVLTLVRDLQTIAKEAGHLRPLLIGIDQENGLVSAFSSPTAGTQFPGAMALAATRDPSLAFQVSAATAKELKMVGINWVYSPVADVNSDSRNPVIGVRSFGDDPQDVAQYVLAVSRGLTSNGVAPSAKHFPGHGDTHTDSHHALPIITKSPAQLHVTELVPFASLTQPPNPIASIMIGHMALPGLTNGEPTPASLSGEVVKGVLRGELGYEGVVVTDCLEMDAIAEPAKGGCGVEEGAVRALKAGADVVMVCHTFEKHVGAVKRVWEEVAGGRLDHEELVRGGERVGRMKDEFVGGWGDVLPAVESEDEFEVRWGEMKKKNRELSREAYGRSVAVVWGKEKLPVKVEEGKEVILFTPVMESLNPAVDDAEGVLRDRSGRLRNTAGASYLALAEEVKKRVGNARHVVYSADGEVEGATDDIGAIVFVLRNADRSVWQREYLKKLLVGKDVPVVLVASCGPYDLVGEDDLRRGTTFVASFEFTKEAFEAVSGVVFDGKEAKGCVPVML